MSKITVEFPDSTPVMALINFASEQGLRLKFVTQDKAVCTPRDDRKVLDLRRNLNPGCVHPHGVVVVPDRNPEPPRAA